MITEFLILNIKLRDKYLSLFLSLAIYIYCCGLQIRPVEEQLKQQVIGERYCMSRKKGSHTKEVLAVLGLQSVCQMSRKKREVVFSERAKLCEYV